MRPNKHTTHKQDPMSVCICCCPEADLEKALKRADSLFRICSPCKFTYEARKQIEEMTSP